MSASKTVGRLQATLGLNRAEFSRELRGARSEAEGFGRSLVSIGNSIRGVLGLSVAGIGIASLARTLRSATSEFARLGSTARDVGMDVEELQGLMRGFARETRVSQDDVSAAFERFNRRIGEAVNAAGPLNATLERLGISIRRTNGQMKTQAELLREVAEAISNARTEQERAAISQAAFGDVGRRMAQALAGGGEAMDRMVREARDAGDVIDRNLIHRAEILDAKFNDLTESVGRFFRAMAVTLATGGVETPADTLERMFGTLERARAILGDGFFEALIRETGELRDQSGVIDTLRDVAFEVEELVRSANWAESEIAGLVFALAEMGHRDASDEMRRLYEGARELAESFRAGTLSTENYNARLEETVQEAVNVVAALGDVDDSRFDNVVRSLGQLIAQLIAVRAAAVDLGQVIVNGVGENGVIVHQADSSSPRPRERPIDWLPEDSLRRGQSRGGGSSRPDDFARAVEAIRQRTRELETEALALTAAAASGREYGDAIMFAQERARLLSAAQRAGVTITEELEGRIDELAEAYVRAGNSAQTAADQLREAENRAMRGADAMSDLFMGMLEGGDAARRAVAQLIAELARVQSMRGMMGLSGGGGFFGRLFSGLGGALTIPGKAKGTSNWEGGMVAINEAGGEILDLPRGTRIIPHDVSKRMADAASNAGSVRIVLETVASPYFDTRVAEISGAGDVQVLQAQQRAMPGMIRDMQARGLK